jgi:hypothetical protein
VTRSGKSKVAQIMISLTLVEVEGRRRYKVEGRRLWSEALRVCPFQREKVDGGR